MATGQAAQAGLTYLEREHVGRALEWVRDHKMTRIGWKYGRTENYPILDGFQVGMGHYDPIGDSIIDRLVKKGIYELSYEDESNNRRYWYYTVNIRALLDLIPEVQATE